MHTHAPQQHPTLLHAEESKSNKQGMGEGLMNLCIERLTNCICSLQENVSYLSYLVLSNVAFIFSISKFPRHPAKKVLHPEGCKEITQLVGDNDDGRVGGGRLSRPFAHLQARVVKDLHLDVLAGAVRCAWHAAFLHHGDAGALGCAQAGLMVKARDDQSSPSACQESQPSF